MANQSGQVNARLTPFEQDKLEYIQRIIGKNQSDAVRMAIIHFAEYLKQEAEKNNHANKKTI